MSNLRFAASMFWLLLMDYNIKLMIRDFYSNVVDSGGYVWNVKIKSPSDLVAVVPAITDRRDGTYLCSFQPTLAGRYMISITGSKTGPGSLDDDGIHLVGSPFKILVVPGTVQLIRDSFVRLLTYYGSCG